MTRSTRQTAATAPAPLPLRGVPVWLALAVALLSSLMTGGLPRTTAYGSAFNPATTAVALQPSRTPPRVLIQRQHGNDDPVPVGGAATLPASVPMRHAAFVGKRGEPTGHIRFAHPIVPRIGFDGAPRAPPLT